MRPFSVLTRFQLIMEILGCLLLLFLTVYLIAAWPTLSDTLPSHYTWDGTADAWGTKRSCITLPVLGWAIYISLTVLLFIPRMWNVPKNHSNPQKQQAIYRMCRSLLCSINFGIVAMFVYISICTVHNAPLGVWFIPVIVFGSIMLNLVFLFALAKIK